MGLSLPPCLSLYWHTLASIPQTFFPFLRTLIRSLGLLWTCWGDYYWNFLESIQKPGLDAIVANWRMSPPQFRTHSCLEKHVQTWVSSLRTSPPSGASETTVLQLSGAPTMEWKTAMIYHVPVHYANCLLLNHLLYPASLLWRTFLFCANTLLTGMQQVLSIHVSASLYPS